MPAVLFSLPQTVPLTTTGALMSGALADFFIPGTTTRQDTFTDQTLGTPHPNPVVADGDGIFPAIFLTATLNYKVDITDSLGVSLPGYPVNNIGSKQDADGIAVADLGSNYTAGEVEAILVEIVSTRGSFAPTFTGWATPPTGTVFWSKSGPNSKIVTLVFAVNASATSNSTSFVMTNLPSTIQAVTAQSLPIIGLRDNGVNLTAASIARVQAASGNVTFGLNGGFPAGGGFTASGDKGFQSNGTPTIQYSLDTLA